MCGKFTDKPVELREMFLSITSGPRILHEAFFDPVDIGSAVGADGSNGVLEPNAFSLDGATTIISSLKWEDGAVTMSVSPTASLADYAHRLHRHDNGTNHPQPHVRQRQHHRSHLDRPPQALEPTATSSCSESTSPYPTTPPSAPSPSAA